MTAINIINVENNEGIEVMHNISDLSVAFMACRYLQNVVKTIKGLPDYSGTFKIVLNDMNAMVLCCDLIILSIPGIIEDAKVAEHAHHGTPLGKTKSPIFLPEISRAPLDTTPLRVSASDEYSPEQYKKLKCKIDWHLLPLMWLCFGLQAADKAVLGIMAIFGLREDTSLIGQQYSWLTTVFYLTYMCLEFPSNFILQRWSMGKTLSIYMGLVILCIGFGLSFVASHG
ncbi:hypothetical protein IW261DRAFT_1649351 [Armillaria novae-zelandiae]|uniref:DUF4470 domain-containing protein n=1 Tax=Armillaria novae-zelandiae TaxID=153914 RepID=A0AA39NZ13_9AGAR|nr:hypothetical protein IW261DRAFT_1649351 [Armillaria novae-zelandiae]